MGIFKQDRDALSEREKMKDFTIENGKICFEPKLNENGNCSENCFGRFCLGYMADLWECNFELEDDPQKGYGWYNMFPGRDCPAYEKYRAIKAKNDQK